MSEEKTRNVSEAQAREVAEASRETEWQQPSFMAEMFLGNFRFDLIDPYPRLELERPEFKEFYGALEMFLRDSVDPAGIDERQDYPPEVVQGLRDLGAFGLKIPTEYGGKGFDQVEYAQIMELMGSYDGNLMALLSAHQSIGVPQPLKLFGTKEQCQEYLPRLAGGEISAFALTEPDVGSDPARLSTTVELEGDFYVLNGKKLWCTNGTMAKLLVVMAMHSRLRGISAFVVETDSPGVEIERRCHFMGLRALANGVINFNNVKIPRRNLIGKEGRGLKIALTTLNDGRLSIPNGAVGVAKRCLKIAREWSSQRVQWGVPIGKHDAIAQKIGAMAETTFAMESIVKLASHMATRGDRDLRLEAAACKEWNSERGWDIIDETLQIRGGRGYETDSSLQARGDKPTGVERMMRDFRINRIFEGSSEIMHLLMAREAVDKHLRVAGTLIDPKTGLGGKLAALPKIALFYAWWYPTRWLGWGRWPRFAGYGRLAKHLRFVERRCRKLARASFHGMVVFGPRLEKRQGFLFRLVDIVNELFAMSASVSRAHAMASSGSDEGRRAIELADGFCRGASRRVDEIFRSLWRNEDARRYGLAMDVLKGDHRWMESLFDRIDAVGSSTESTQPAPQTAPVA